jgi:TPR repeat protein/uncharacterized membrane protein
MTGIRGSVAEDEGGARSRPKKRGAKKGAAAKAPSLPADLKPSRVFSLTGGRLFAPSVFAVGLLALSFLPRIAGQAALAMQVRAGAGLLVVANVLLAMRASREKAALEAQVIVRRPHWVQMLTQSGVYAYWGRYWAEVAAHVPLIAAQVLFVYAFDALFGWWRRRPWVLGFAHMPIVLSTNLFMWFKDDYFGVQLALVAFAVASKEIRWRRGGASRHVFNPSSIALAVVSAALLVTGTTNATWAYDIALTQDHPPNIHLVLFCLGLIVQLNFPVVLVTMSSCVALALAGAVYTSATGVYMFTTTAIPGAVMLGSLLLVTDPATSPESRTGKVLFGASYGLLVFALYPLLEKMGPYGFYDKLLPVPFLNLLVPRYEAVGERLGARIEAAWKRVTGGAMAWVTAPRAGNFVHVGVWAGAFGLLLATHAVGAEHEGRSNDFWIRACEEKKPGACERLYTMFDNDCDKGVAVACHALGEVIAEGKARARRRADEYFRAACDKGMAPSCSRLGDLLRTSGGDAGGAAVLYRKACDAGDGAACRKLADAYRNGAGVPADPRWVYALEQKACDLGAVEGCSSVAALDMNRGGAADKAHALEAFRKACDGGDMTGCANLGVAYALGDGVPVDLARSAEYQKRACDGKVAVACARLADMAKAGKGVPADPQRASVLLQRACALGFAPACGGRP